MSWVNQKDLRTIVLRYVNCKEHCSKWNNSNVQTWQLQTESMNVQQIKFKNLVVAHSLGGRVGVGEAMGREE